VTSCWRALGIENWFAVLAGFVRLRDSDKNVCNDFANSKDIDFLLVDHMISEVQ
jgi:hypothetical protein